MLSEGLISKGDEKLYVITDDIKAIRRRLAKNTKAIEAAKEAS